MSTPDQAARDHDRNAAIRTVEAAFAAGRIVEADRDKRIEELRRARTLLDVQMVVHDLQPAAAPAPASVSVAPTYATPEDRPADASGRISTRVLVLPLVVVLVVAAALIGGIVGLVGVLGDSDAIPAVADEEGRADVLSATGYADLLDAVREQTGGTVAFEAVLYPAYAVVELPVDTTTNREEYWYWDGRDLSRNDSKSTSTWPRVDLASVDPDVIVALVGQVQQNVEDPTSYYAIVRAPDDDRAVVWAYATNEYGETAYLGARRDGRVTYDSTEH